MLRGRWGWLGLLMASACSIAEPPTSARPAGSLDPFHAEDRGVAGADPSASLAGAEAAAPGVARPTEALIEVSTKPIGGNFGSKNVGAIWVEDLRDEPIKILEVWAAASRSALTNFNTRGLPKSLPVDVVVSATQRMHGVHRARWDLTDLSGAPVPDGHYVIWIEAADNHETTALATLAFIKGAAPVLVELPETAQFGPITLTYR